MSSCHNNYLGRKKSDPMGLKQTYRVKLTKLTRGYLETYLRAGTHSTRLLIIESS